MVSNYQIFLCRLTTDHTGVTIWRLVNIDRAMLITVSTTSLCKEVIYIDQEKNIMIKKYLKPSSYRITGKSGDPQRTQVI